ncbi:class I SAM-dependent methyltransferase [Candidatus Kuenenia sp.]|uniref:class I SAM-dependent methyltransferase n=1 Tax=Candidatus Kuenenia sp. TaxID=2499824 RepID=UPI00321FC6C3
MIFTLEKVVPWGRSFDEYLAMFALSEDYLWKRILGCGDGPASFNCIMTRRGGHVVSVDPIYRFGADEIRNRIDETYEQVIEQTRNNKNEFVWEHISSVEELGNVRMAAMNDFLSDYAAGLREGRYVDASLPTLPFEDGEFDIALCSNFLFLYSEHLSEDFHVQSIKELCRVASEARIFPLLELGAKKSRHLQTVVDRLEKSGFVVNVEKVPYEFQKGGNEMLRLIAT